MIYNQEKQQDYTNIKKALTLLAEDEQAGKAARYAKFTIQQIKRYELAYEVEKAVRLQDAQFDTTKQAIETAHQAKLSSTPNLGKYAVVGTLKLSNIYGPEMQLRHYNILDKNGKILCYALPIGSKKTNLEKYIGKKIGLIGKIETFVQTKSSLVRFTSIDILP